MPNASAEHELLISFLAGALLRFIARHDLPYVARVNAGVQTEDDTSRLPDIAVYDRDAWERLLKKGGPAVLRLGEPLRLAVKVTSGTGRTITTKSERSMRRGGFPNTGLRMVAGSESSFYAWTNARTKPG